MHLKLFAKMKLSACRLAPKGLSCKNVKLLQLSVNLRTIARLLFDSKQAKNIVMGGWCVG
jgi:hypothetical protein